MIFKYYAWASYGKTFSTPEHFSCAKREELWCRECVENTDECFTLLTAKLNAVYENLRILRLFYVIGQKE